MGGTGIVIAGTTVAESYERCRRMQRRHDPTFYMATRRLPAAQRPAVHALYGFLRGADELVDGPRRPADADRRRAALDAWEAALRDGVRAGRSDHPVIAALVDAGARHDLPLHLLPTYVDSMRVDCADRVRIATEAELDRYMNGSAATVGRVMAPILGAPERGEDFARLGVAFQLTNFVRDVREDARMDRHYLPGVEQDEREAARRAVERARAMFAETAGLDGAAPARVGSGIRLARAVYERVLDRIEALDFEVKRRRTSLPPWQLGMAAAGAMRR